MAMSISDILRKIAPEFATVSGDELDIWISLSKPFVSKKIFGDLYEQAVAYLTAHRMKVGGLGDTSYGTVGESMRLSSVSEGGVSVSFNNPSASSSSDTDADLMLTPYGMQFLHIRRMRVIPIMCSGEDVL